MLSKDQAFAIVDKAFPDCDIKPPIEYKDLYLFMVFNPLDEVEGSMDPFFSVNKNTGELRDFSLSTDGDTDEIMTKFTKVLGL